MKPNSTFNTLVSILRPVIAHFGVRTLLNALASILADDGEFESARAIDRLILPPRDVRQAKRQMGTL